MTDDLWVSLLGPIMARRGGAELYLGTPRQREVLAVLALRRGTVMSVAQIVDAVWASRRPVSVENMVHTYVGRLRRVLEPAGQKPTPATVLRSTRPGYTLALASEHIDVFQFEHDIREARSARAAGDLTGALRRFHQATTRWGGSPLHEATGPLAEAERTRLVELRQDILEEITGLRLLLGDDENLVSELRRMLVEQPMRERLWELLLVALGQASRRAEALTAFQDARITLTERLGVEPGYQLQDLHRRLLRSEPVGVRPWWDRPVRA
jgi:DNA-binding SARP family transcriptional activator